MGSKSGECCHAEHSCSTAKHDDHQAVDHPFHLVDPSPWPILAALGFFTTTLSTAFYFHGKAPGYAILVGIAILLYVGFRWWKDCVKESAVDHAHTPAVQKGLRIGMLMFIVSEVMFFFAFFFSFFHSAVASDSVAKILLLAVATVISIVTFVMAKTHGKELLSKAALVGVVGFIAGIALTVGVHKGHFPPTDLKTINAWDLPLFNTMLLLLSGTTVTWAHASLLEENRKGLIRGLIMTILLGLTFTSVQAYEYRHAFHELFKFDDNNYSANFYMATGFHGLHVIIGTIFLTVCLIRAIKGQFSEEHHLGFEFAAWYWHFVDVVWLFLFTFVYVWSGWGHAH